MSKLNDILDAVIETQEMCASLIIKNEELERRVDELKSENGRLRNDIKIDTRVLLSELVNGGIT